MMTKRVLGIAVCLAGSIVSAQGEDADPVLRAKAQRALDNHQDLPPIPRGLTEPPPLPPPEMHAHDIRKKRVATNATARSNIKKAAPAKKATTANSGVKKATTGTMAKPSNNSTTKTQSKSNQRAAKPSGASSTAKTQNKSAVASTAKPSNNSNAKAQSKSAPAKTTKSANASTAAKKAAP